MAPSREENLTVRHLLIPVTLLALIVFLILAFQTMQILRDRDSLNMAKGQQENAFSTSQRLQGQLNALLGGTKKLADEGNKSAKDIVEKLKSIGIQMEQPGQAQPGQGIAPAPVPVAQEKAPSGPVKP